MKENLFEYIKSVKSESSELLDLIKFDISEKVYFYGEHFKKNSPPSKILFYFKYFARFIYTRLVNYKLKNQIYELNSVCCHISSNHLFGHYFSIVKSDEKWFILDDNSVNEAEEEHVKNIILQHGYIFFYHKI